MKILTFLKYRKSPHSAAYFGGESERLFARENKRDCMKKLLIVGALSLSLVLGGCATTTQFGDYSDVVVDGFKIRIVSKPRHFVAYYASSEEYGPFAGGVPASLFTEAAVKAIEIHTGCKVGTFVHFFFGSTRFVDATVKCSERL